jgi:hypothetical protein
MADEPGDEPPAEKQKYDQEFFIAIALKGKDAWNAWRRDPANNDVSVIFAGIDFSEAPRDRIDFSGFEFGDLADFWRCKWRGATWAEMQQVPHDEAFARGRARFTSAAFGNDVRFAAANFGKNACFDDATFGNNAYFIGTNFDDVCAFNRAIFGHRADFKYAAFGYFADFTSAAFGRGARFNSATFGGGADFSGAAFGGGANFDEAFFKSWVEFTGKSKEQLRGELAAKMNVMDAGARTALESRHVASWVHYDSGPDRFLAVSFTNARFDGEADFSGRSFERDADFTNARFYRPPNFDLATNIASVPSQTFESGFGANMIHWWPDGQATANRAAAQIAH